MSVAVTVIIPSYNHADYIENAIGSVLAQDTDDFELIVIDDGSSDDTEEILEKYRSNPKVTVIINKKNKGQGAVINQALKFARGSFICFLPSDDWYLTDKLSKQLQKFSEVSEKVGVVYARGYRYFSDIDKTLPVNLPMYKGNVLEKLILESNFIYPVTPMFRRECFEQFPFDESFVAEGEAIYLKISTRYEFEYIDDYVAVMRDHTRNTGKQVGTMYAENLRYWTEFFEKDYVPESAKAISQIPLIRLHRLKGIESVVLDNNYTVGRRALCSAIGMKWSLVFDVRVLFALSLTFLPSPLADKCVKIFRKLRKNKA